MKLCRIVGLALALVALTGAGGKTDAHAHTERCFLDALRAVETGGQPNGGVGAIGDGGKAYGPLQIHKGYWQDSRVPGSHADCLTSREYSERVVLAYMKRYAPKSLEAGDWEKLARIHNGGPKGHTKSATVKYWAKVQKAMK